MAAATGIQPRLRQGIAQLLADQDVCSWSADDAVDAEAALPPVFDTQYPDAPDVAAALSTYYVGGDDPTLAGTWLQLQVRTRGHRDGPMDAADDLDDAIGQVLLGRWPTTLPNGVRISFLTRTSGTPIGRDAAGRFERTTNWRIRVHDPAPNRIS